MTNQDRSNREEAMSTSTEEKRYRTELITALRLRNISGPRIGDIVAEVEVHTEETGRPAREAFGAPKEYARQFEPRADERARRRLGWPGWTGVVTAAVGAWLLCEGAFAGMTDTDVNGIPGWWACAIGAVVLLVTFSLIPIDAIVDPRRPATHRYGRRWLLSWVAGAMVIVVLGVVALMSVLT